MFFFKRGLFLRSVNLLRHHSEMIEKELKINYLTGSDSGIVEFGLNRPAAKNSFSKSAVNSLNEALDSITHDKKVRVLILRSLVPGVFCAGADLKERIKLTPHEVQQFVNSLRTLMTRFNNLGIPVIAALDGVALGGGLELALACDIRTAATSAKIGLVEAKLAIFPAAGGTQRLARLIGPGKAKELIYTARVLNGKEAFNMGIVNQVVEQNEQGTAAYERALAIAREIIPNGPIGIRLAKEAINEGIEVSLASGLKIEEFAYAQVIPTKDRIEGLRSFLEKRKPEYIGE